MTSDGMSNILEEIQCSAWVSTREQPRPVEGQASYVLPSLEDLLVMDDKATPYPYDESWEQAKDDIACIIHTSGTTGTVVAVTEPVSTYNAMKSSDFWHQDFPSQSTFEMDSCPSRITGTR
jgi:acyl-coenzyme A synthetase/AMP-(fatty) acid ligase